MSIEEERLYTMQLHSQFGQLID